MKTNGAVAATAGSVQQSPENIHDFDDILEVVGSAGRYQRLMLYGVMTPLTIVLPFLVLQWIFIMSVPDHWCHVPGKPETMTLEGWKNLTLPREIGPNGQSRFSQCEMYDSSRTTTVKCSQWEYDTSNYDNTMPSEFNWVCDNSQYVADSFSAGTIGSVVGTVILGNAADKFGRKPIYFLTIGIYMVFYAGSIAFANSFGAFLTFRFLQGFAFPFIFSSPCMIAAELSGKTYRSWIYSLTWMVWVGGNCFLPIVAYLCRSWFLFGVISPIPAVFLFLYYKVLEESPRWLISVGRMEEAGKIIHKIAKYNGTNIEAEFLEKALESIKRHEMEFESKKKTVGMWTLFTKKRLAINTILLCVAWSGNSLIYYGLTLNTTSMSGNEFLNYFYLGLVELPGGWLAGVLVEKTGRRWTQAAFFGVSAFGFIVAAFAVLNPNGSLVVLAAILLAKFAVSITSLVIYLQGTELFPTPLRSSGNGLLSTVASAVGILAPYIVYLNKLSAAVPYAVLAITSLIGAACAVFLPETLNQKLPETIEDANKFGKDHRFWSYLPEEINKSSKPAKDED